MTLAGSSKPFVIPGRLSLTQTNPSQPWEALTNSGRLQSTISQPWETLTNFGCLFTNPYSHGRL